MSNHLSMSQKKTEEKTINIDKSLEIQKEKLTEWKNNPQNQEDYRVTSKDKMNAINKEFMDGIKNLYGVTEAVPVSKNGPQQSVPVSKSWWLSRRSEEKKLSKARNKYGEQISVNSIREQKSMEEYESIREKQVRDYDDNKQAYSDLADIKVKKFGMHADSLKLDVNIEGYDDIVRRQQLNYRPKHYIRIDEINKGLTPFLVMQKSSWFFWKKTVGALGNETAEEKNSPKDYNKRLIRQYTKSKAGSQARAAILDELRKKIQSFKITPDMLTDGYLADHSAQLRRFADMTQAFRVLIDTNPGYLEGLSEEDRIMLGNTLNYTGPLIRNFLEKHQQCKHLVKKGRKTVFSRSADMDLNARNDELMKETWEKIHQADVAEQTAIGLNHKSIRKYLNKMEKDAADRRKKEQKLPDYAITLQYDTTGEGEKRLLDLQEKIRGSKDTYDLIGDDMEKLFDQFSKSCITLDTLRAKHAALWDTTEKIKNALKNGTQNRKYSAFVQYAARELKKLDHDISMLDIQADQYEKTLKFVTDIKITDDDMIIPEMDEKDAEAIKNVLKTEDLSFLLKLNDCRFYAKEFTELTGGKYDFRSGIKETIQRARGQEVKLHTDKIAGLEETHGAHKLTLQDIIALKPQDLEKYNFDGYTEYKDGKAIRHKGAHDLTDEVNFKHMKEIESIASIDLGKAREELEKSYTPERTEEILLDLETKLSLFKDYNEKWKGTYKGIKTDSWKYLSQVPDMEGQNGIFNDPHVFEDYKNKLQAKLDKTKAENPDSENIPRLEDMIAFMDAMMIRNGLGFSGDEDIKLMNAEAYKSRLKQIKYTKRENKALRSFLKNPSPEWRTRLLNRVEDVLFYEDKYAELKEKRGEALKANFMKKELDEKLKDIKDEKLRHKTTCEYYADQAVKMVEYKNKLTPEFFTKEYIRNNFDDFASTALALRDFGMMINSQETFEMMREGLSAKNQDNVLAAVDGIIKIADRMQILLITVFSANSINFRTGQISARSDLLKLQMEVTPEEKLAKKYRDAVEAVKERNKAEEEAKAKAEKEGKKYTKTLHEVREDTEISLAVFKTEIEAGEFKSEIGEDYLDYDLTFQLRKFRDMDTFLEDMKKDLYNASSPTEELYRYLYKEAGDLSDAGNKEAWKKVLTKASEKKSTLLIFAGLSKEARNVAKEMLKNPGQINDYLQWKVRQDSRVYMNERSNALGIKESQEDTNIAYEIMDSMEETHSSVHNSANRKMRQTLFPELEKKGIDPEQFMHLLRIVHRTTGGNAGRMVDITNQSANIDRTEKYLDSSSKKDFLKQVTSDVMSFEIRENMLTEEYLKEPGNFRYMYFMVQKLKAYEQLYKNDRDSIEEALKDTEGLMDKVNERFGTFYGNISDQLYRLVMNFAAKYGVNENGARTFGLSPEEYEQLTVEGKTKEFASKSMDHMENAETEFEKNVSDIRKRNAQRTAAVSAVDSIRKYDAKWLRKKYKPGEFAYKAVYQEKQTEINKQIITGMEKAMEVKDAEEDENTRLKKVIKLDNRLKVNDVAYFLPEGYHKKFRSDDIEAEWDKDVLSLKDLFSGNKVQQINYLLQDDHLEKIVDVFRRNKNISKSSKEDLYSEDYLEKAFSEELFTDARKMAVYSLLPNIIAGLFDEDFITGAVTDDKAVMDGKEYYVMNTTLESKKSQIKALTDNAEDLFKQGKYTKQEYEDAQEVIERLNREVAFAEIERQSLLPKLKTKEQKGKLGALLKELKTYIGTEGQRDFYKLYADNINKYIQICGVNVDSPENSLGSLISGMEEKKLGVILGDMELKFSGSQNALRQSMNHAPKKGPSIWDF